MNLFIVLMVINKKEGETARIDACEMLVSNNRSAKKKKKKEEISSSYQRRQAPSDWLLVA